MTETQTLTPQQQIDRIKALLQTTKNPKQIRQYKALIRGLQAQLKPVVPEPQQQPEPPQKEELEPIETPQAIEKETLFSAVGVIKGVVMKSDTEGKVSYQIKIGDKQYNLGFTSKHLRHNFNLEIANSGTTEKYLLVYPKLTHFPDKNKPYIVGFQIKGWKNDPYENWEINEFKLRGLWQFIPVCRGPVISIHKNKTPDRIEWLKDESVELARKVAFLKATHIPLLWRDSPIKPFRFNPKAEKGKQGGRYFVQVKARFLPGRDCWGFVEQIEHPRKDSPKFLKPRKQATERR